MSEPKKCDECFERKPDVKWRDYHNAQIPMCDACFEQNQGRGQEESRKEATQEEFLKEG